MTLTNEIQLWVAKILGFPPIQLTYSPLAGANASPLFLVETSTRQRFVLRIFDDKTWLTEEPDLAQHTAAAMQEAQHADVIAPRAIAHSTIKETKFPVVLESFLEGTPRIFSPNASWLRQAAQQLARLHQHHPVHFPWTYQSWVDPGLLQPPHWSAFPGLWQQAIEHFNQGAPHYPRIFIHRDYHPLNLLWQDENLCGVVDWVHACMGPAGVDVSHFRVNLALLFDVETADAFLDYYQDYAPNFVYESYWDIDSILDMTLPEPEFYRPWEGMGIKVLSAREMGWRVDRFLQSVLAREENLSATSGVV